MDFFEIIKEGFRVANRNLAVLLTQVIVSLLLVLIFFLFSGLLLFLAIGSIPLGLESLSSLSAQNLPGLLETSITLIALGVFLALLFVIIAALMTSYVHSGNLGCIIDTASGKSNSFTSDTFFRVGHRSMFSMLGLYIIWGIIFFAGGLVLLAIGGVGYEGVLLPLGEAGRRILAFTLGVPFIVALIVAGLLFLFFLYAGSTFSRIILVGEAKRAFSSLSASYHFIKHNFWDSLLFALLMFALVFIAYILSSVITMPISLVSHIRPFLVLSFLPLYLLGVLIHMYIVLIANSSFVVYYLHRTGTLAAAPTETPSAPAPADDVQPV
ncbi:MAG: hypothetical protein ABSG42_07575 [Nitrospirota bacterium]